MTTAKLLNLGMIIVNWAICEKCSLNSRRYCTGSNKVKEKAEIIEGNWTKNSIIKSKPHHTIQANPRKNKAFEKQERSVVINKLVRLTSPQVNEIKGNIPSEIEKKSEKLEKRVTRAVGKKDLLRSFPAKNKDTSRW